MVDRLHVAYLSNMVDRLHVAYLSNMVDRQHVAYLSNGHLRQAVCEDSEANCHNYRLYKKFVAALAACLTMILMQI